MRTFALIGAAGYVAPRHLKAVKAVGGELLIAFDPVDSVGVLDEHFPEAEFVTSLDGFNTRAAAFAERGRAIEYVSICSPNHLHETHCRLGLGMNANVICEKPLVVDPAALDKLAEAEQSSGCKISTIMQLRLHPSMYSLKEKVAASGNKRMSVSLTYIAARGPWYHTSWKGDEAKSGGIATNIGIHLFDLLSYAFGRVKTNVVHVRDAQRAAGFVEFDRADVQWFLSIDRKDLGFVESGGRPSYRSMVVDGEAVDFSEGFNDLHTLSYREILAGRGFGLEAVRGSIETVAAVRSLPLQPQRGEVHPLALIHRA
jgi:UDP-N-acetyl-2-amino-2-deoxyglucuronate dehydrogenase